MAYLATATMCTALVRDFGLVTETDQAMIVDKSKVRRKINTFETNQIGNFTQSNGDEQTDAIYFDGRKSQTLFQLEVTGGLTHLKEEHYVLVGQTHGEYMTHSTL